MRDSDRGAIGGAALQADRGCCYGIRGLEFQAKIPKGWRGEADPRYEMLCAAGLLPLPGGGRIHMP